MPSLYNDAHIWKTLAYNIHRLIKLVIVRWFLQIQFLINILNNFIKQLIST